MHKMTFSLSISADKYQRYYQGAAKSVIVHTDDGRRLKFPASNLIKFVGHDGIHGRFAMTFDENNKIVSLQKIG